MEAKRKSKVRELEFRLEQIEIAVMNLMFVVAHPEKELSNFKQLMERAEKMSKKQEEIFSMMVNEEGAEA
tara:strand:- start:140 stop:349 length:210 start_codon:yes stop_codon:yes gene_type:complete